MLSQCDAELVNRDPSIVGLSTVFDPDALLALMREELPDTGFRSAEMVYVRYKPGTNCLAQFKLRTDVGTYDVFATAYGTGADAKIAKALEVNSSSSPLGPGRLVFERQAIVVNILPNDTKIKALNKLSDPDRRISVLKDLLPENPELWEVELHGLRYKPKRRYVAALLKDGRPRASVKLYTPRTYPAAKAAAMAFQNTANAQFGHLLGHSDKYRALAFKWMPGEVLSDAYTRPGFSCETIEHAGEALARLHALEKCCLKRHSTADEITALCEQSVYLGTLCTRSESLATKLVDRLTRLLNGSREEARTVHGDFYANQVIVGAEGLTVLDFDRAAHGNPILDLGNFMAHLEYDQILGRLSSAKCEAYRRSILLGYTENPAVGLRFSREITDTVNSFTAAGLLRLAANPFREHLPNWDIKICEVLSRAETILNSGRLTLQKNETDARAHPVCADHQFRADDDADMPLLSRALDPGEMRRSFANVPQTAQGELRSIELVRYKRHRRALLKYEFNLDGGNVALLGKMRAKGTDLKTYSLQRELYTKGFGDDSPDGVSVPEAIVVIPDLNMWLQRRVDGKSAFELLPNIDDNHVLGLVAKAIHKLHSAAVDQTLNPHSVCDELKILSDRLALVAQSHPRLQTRLSRVFHSCARASECLVSTRNSLIHRDFYGDQLLITENGHVYLLDLDICSIGDPALDVGNFVGHMTEFALRKFGSERFLSEKEEALADAYSNLAGTDLSWAIETYATLTLARHIYLSTQFAERQPYTEDLVDICERRLGIGTALCAPASAHNDQITGG